MNAKVRQCQNGGSVAEPNNTQAFQQPNSQLPTRGRDTRVRDLGASKARRASESSPVDTTEEDQMALEEIAAALLELKYGALRVYKFMNKKKAKMLTKNDVAM
jgi:hypothetical protein